MYRQRVEVVYPNSEVTRPPRTTGQYRFEHTFEKSSESDARMYRQGLRFTLLPVVSLTKGLQVGSPYSY